MLQRYNDYNYSAPKVVHENQPTTLPLGSPYTTPKKAAKASHHSPDSGADADIDDITTSPIGRLSRSKKRRIAGNQATFRGDIMGPTEEVLRRLEASDTYMWGILLQLLGDVASEREEINNVLCRLLRAERVRALLK